MDNKRKIMKRTILIILLLCTGLLANSQNERKYVRKGNDIFMKAVKDTTKLDTTLFRQAETEYRKALEKKPQDTKWNFNLADALYKQMQFDQSAKDFDHIANELKTPEEKARAYHNKGNSLLFDKKIDQSIQAYEEALKNNPRDMATKYNLAFAQALKKRQQQQKKNQNKNGKNKDKQNQDKNKDQQNKNQKQNQDQKQKQDQNKNQQNQDQKQQQQTQNKISKANAEQLLQALQNDEKKIQAKVKKEQLASAKKIKVDKDW